MAERDRANSPNKLDLSQFAHPAALDAWIDAATRTMNDARGIGEEQLADDWADLIDQASRARGQVQKDWDGGRKDQVGAADEAARHRLRGEQPPDHILRAAGQASQDTQQQDQPRGGGKPTNRGARR